jgi:CubicO group peptidase (beta-lactamase class C family)
MKRSIILICFLSFSFILTNCHSQNKQLNHQGIWEGFIVTPNEKIRLLYRIWRLENGTVKVIHDSPDYGIINIKDVEATVKNDKIRISINLFSAEFHGSFNHNTLTGTYDSGFPIPLTLNRISHNPDSLLPYMVPGLDDSGTILKNKAYSIPKTLNDNWIISDPAKLGCDTVILNKMMTEILHEKFKNIHGIVVVKDNQIVTEEYFYGFNENKYHPIHSVSKSFAATLVGIATDEGKIKSLETPLLNFFPKYTEILSQHGKDSIKLCHVLSMTAGFTWDEQSFSYFDQRNSLVKMQSNQDGLAYLFSQPLTCKPGKKYVYNTGLSIVIEPIIQNITNKPYHEYLKEHLMDPLEITNYKHDIGGLYLCPRDMAKYGNMFLNDGKYGERQIVSEQWVERSLNRFETCKPSYWNHWYPVVFCHDGIMIHAFQAGGFGGQSITIIPKLKTVVALTGGNFIEQADYDKLITGYIIPSIITKKYIKEHPEIKEDLYHSIGDLNIENKWNSEMACIKSSIDFLNKGISDSWLYGMTGMAFFINVDERAFPKSNDEWNKTKFYKLCENMGFGVETMWSHKSAPDFKEKQKIAWDKVRHSIDNKIPCYGFNLGNPLRYMITGYDGCGYYYKNPKNEYGKTRVLWDDLGNNTIGLLGMHFVNSLDQQLPEKEMVKQALAYAVECFNNPDKWTYSNCKTGKEGYDRLIELALNGNADPEGMTYVLASVEEYRFYAIKYLHEIKPILGKNLEPILNQTIQHYQESFENIKMASDLFPVNLNYTNSHNDLNNDEKRNKVAGFLEKAKAAEIKGMELFKEIIEKI